MDNKEMTFLSRRMFNFYKRRYRNSKNKGISRENHEAITCYECKKPGHVRAKCPQFVKGRRDRKNLVANASWSDDDLLESELDSKEPEIENICLMENKDSEEDTGEVSDLPISYDELSHVVDTLVEDSKNVLQKYHDRRRAHLKRLKDFETIVSGKNYFKEKGKQMKEEQCLPH